jgi:hypothetical protein
MHYCIRYFDNGFIFNKEGEEMKTKPLILITIILIILVIFFGPKHDEPFVDNGIYIGNLDSVTTPDVFNPIINHSEIPNPIKR